MKYPYNVTANFRIASAYKELGKLEESKQFIKRIVIWENTDKNIKNLYMELFKCDQRSQERKDVITKNNYRNLFYPNNYRTC